MIRILRILRIIKDWLSLDCSQSWSCEVDVTCPWSPWPFRIPVTKHPWGTSLAASTKTSMARKMGKQTVHLFSGAHGSMTGASQRWAKMTKDTMKRSRRRNLEKVLLLGKQKQWETMMSCGFSIPECWWALKRNVSRLRRPGPGAPWCPRNRGHHLSVGILDRLTRRGLCRGATAIGVASKKKWISNGNSERIWITREQNDRNSRNDH